jgi:ATP-dependent Clp protease adapter protein ClpS
MVTSSAGLLVQCALLIITLAYVGIFGIPRSAPAVSQVTTFIYVNIAMFVLNLIPEKPRGSDLATDGYLVWELINRKIRGLPYAYPDTSATFTPETRLYQIAGFVPEGFSTGIEILNDNTTPMEFVVEMMTTHLKMSREKAIELMLAVHTKGGLLVPLETYEGAVRTAAAISADAAAKGHALMCRAVDVRKLKHNHAGAA